MQKADLLIHASRLGVVSVLAAFTLAACGSPEEAETTAAPEMTQAPETEAEEEVQTAAHEEGALDMDTYNPQYAGPTNASAVMADGTDFVMGYAGTPRLPASDWNVHDPERPRPEVVTPQTGLYTPPPSDATVLFDGDDFDGWVNYNEEAPEWVVEDGMMRVPSDIPHSVSADIRSVEEFGDMQLHIEWRTPPEVVSGSQGRGNSGVFLMGRYEVQVLDSYQNETYADGQASAIYGWKPPLNNAMLPPGEWQSYDIVFEAPRFAEDGMLESPAYVTVFHNGVLTQYRERFLGISGHQNILPYEAHEERGPIKLQDHGNPVAFRNIWVRDLDLESND